MPFPSSTLTPISSLFFLFLTPALAANASELCYWELEYSPFTPWFRGWSNVTSGPGDNVQNLVCWWYADCCFSASADTRKQQYAATALIMGLMPLIVKDIAWPERRIAGVQKKLHWGVEICVRALGLNPVIKKKKEGRTFSRANSRILFVLLVLLLLSLYGVLVVIEIFSKRSSLGCPMPAFVAVWSFCALFPATLEVGVAQLWPRNDDNKPSPRSDEGESKVVDEVTESRFSPTISDNIPGGEHGWFVQLIWAVYYAAGTLVFSSIMLVTVVELLVWVLAICALTATSKLLAYKLCGHWGTRLE